MDASYLFSSACVDGGEEGRYECVRGGVRVRNMWPGMPVAGVLCASEIAALVCIRQLPYHTCAGEPTCRFTNVARHAAATAGAHVFSCFCALQLTTARRDETPAGRAADALAEKRGFIELWSSIVIPKFVCQAMTNTKKSALANKLVVWLNNMH